MHGQNPHTFHSFVHQHKSWQRKKQKPQTTNLYNHLNCQKMALFVNAMHLFTKHNQIYLTRVIKKCLLHILIAKFVLFAFFHTVQNIRAYMHT